MRMSYVHQSERVAVKLWLIKSLLIVHEVLLETRILAAIDNGAIMLFAMGLASSMGISILLLLHDLLIEHFLVSNLVINLII